MAKTPYVACDHSFSLAPSIYHIGFACQYALPNDAANFVLYNGRMETHICYLVARGLSRDEATQFVERLQADIAQWREAIIRLTADNVRMKGQIANLLHQESVF